MLTTFLCPHFSNCIEDHLSQITIFFVPQRHRVEEEEEEESIISTNRSFLKRKRPNVIKIKSKWRQ